MYKYYTYLWEQYLKFGLHRQVLHGMAKTLLDQILNQFN